MRGPEVADIGQAPMMFRTVSTIWSMSDADRRACTGMLRQRAATDVATGVSSIITLGWSR